MNSSGTSTTRFLKDMLMVELFLTVCTFSLLAIFINGQSKDTIRQVSQMYMSSISDRIPMHFETIIGLRLDQLDALVKTSGQDDIHGSARAKSLLISSAQAQGFSHLAFYRSDGNFEMLYGRTLQVTDPAPFQRSLLNQERKVAVGTDRAGEGVILFGIPVQHQPDEKNPCLSLVAALPESYITETLSLDENDDHVYSFIIRKDGSYIVRTYDAFENNYFDRVRQLYESVDGKNPETYIHELTRAMGNGESYSASFVMRGETRQLYCSKLPDSEWFLMTFMPYNALDDIINGAAIRWTFILFSGCAFVLTVLLLIFRKYFQMTRHQVEELEKARKAAVHANKAKSEFLSNMSHDIRTPMNAIVGMTAIAAANIDDRGQVQNCLQKIDLSSRHLLSLINDVLDMSKIESGKLTLNIDQVSLREVMDSIVSIVQPQVRAKRQQFDVSVHDISSENVYCDSVRLNQVILNLLGNALKFTPEEGSIQVSLRQEDSPKGEELVRIHLSVKDNGIGMTPEFKEKIFESFVREDNARVHKTEGSGLGMTITKYIVDAMGGTIEVESELGKGSEFLVTLDLRRAEAPEQEMLLPEWNILVVDDDRQLCESAAAALNSMGAKADWTLNAGKAMEMIGLRAGGRDAYQIILLDWKLPDIDGVTAAREIRARVGPGVPILLISAYDWSEIEAEARAAGINGFIAKPLFRSTLFCALKPLAGEDDIPQEIGEETLGDFSGTRVLLAEDNDLNWEIASELLSDLGMELEWAENGRICVDKFESSPVGFYDAVLMDLRMPVMTGYEATAAIRKLDRPDADIPIIAMTADAFAEDIKKCLDCGMNAHVAKPIDIREVSRLLDKFINGRY